MAYDDSPGEGRLTAESDTIRDWTEQRDVVPVRESGERVRLVPESEADRYGERVDWDEFERALSDRDLVVVHREDAEPGREFEVLDREVAVSRASVESEAVEEALMAGETVTSEITETRVVERTLVEQATVESEVVDREVVDERVVDAELVSREVLDCEFHADPSVEERDRLFADWTETATVAHRRTDAGTTQTTEATTTAAETEVPSTFEDEVALTVDEDWSLTKEVLERVTVRSRVVDVEAEETDTLESDTVEETVDLEGVQRTVLEGELLASEAAAEEVVRGGHVESRFVEEGDAVETTLAERRTVEDEISRRLRMRGRLDERSVESAEIVETAVVDSEVVEEAESLADATPVVHAPGDETAVAGMETEEAAGVETAEEPVRTTPSDDDVGKDVVDPGGEEIGMVSAVEGDTLYVDPHPTLTDRIRAALDWEDVDEDAYPLGPEDVLRITDDEVRVDVDVEPRT